MSSNPIYTPYCYLIGWSASNMFYYGRRTAVGCSPDELMVSYHTSSGFVEDYIKIHGKPDIIQIRKTFDTAEKTAWWETTVLRRLNAAKHPRMLNDTNGDLNFDRTGQVSCIDTNSGKSVSVTTEEYQSNKDRYTTYMTNKVNCIDSYTGMWISVTTEEYQSNKDRYTTHMTNKVNCIDGKNGKNVVINKDIFHSNKDRYTTHNKNTVICIDSHIEEWTQIAKEEYHSNKDRYVHIASNHVAAMDLHDGEIKHIPIEEFRTNRDRYVGAATNRVVIENITTKERTIVETGTEIDRTTHKFITGKPLGTKETQESRKLKSEAGKKKLTVRHNEKVYSG